MKATLLKSLFLALFSATAMSILIFSVINFGTWGLLVYFVLSLAIGVIGAKHFNRWLIRLQTREEEKEQAININ